MTEDKQARDENFAKHYPLWIALSHFLSADLVRELAQATVVAGSGGTLGLADLFEERRPEGSPELTSWVVRPKADQDGLARYLQDVVRALIWQSDTHFSFEEGRIPEANHATCRALELALTLAPADFDSIDYWMDRAQQAPPALRALGDAIYRVSRRDDEPAAATVAAIDRIVEAIDSHLAALIAKHLGDLALDVDDAALALALYERADAKISSNTDAQWRALLNAVSDMTLQSVATVRGMISDPGETVKALTAVYDDEVFQTRPLLGMNAPLAAMNARYKASDSFQLDSDIRACMLITPQLQAGLDLSTSLERWADNKFNDAHRRFWATLRRLNALGGATLSTQAMSYFGRSMFDELGRLTQRQRDPTSFEVALQLLVGSGRTEAIGPEASRRELVDAYVTQGAVRQALAIAVRHPGVRRERLAVVITLFEAWLSVLSSDEEAVATLLIKSIADLAQEPATAVFGRDLAVISFEALKTLAKQRPEFISLGSAMIADAVVTGCASEQFRVGSAAFETAVACAEGLAQDDLRRVVETALQILEQVEPSDGRWPIVQPAISLVSGNDAQALWPNDKTLASRSAQCVLRHGIGSASENTRLLALIDDIRPYLDPAMVGDERIRQVVGAVREGAQKINNSGVAGNIAVLFSAGALVGQAGIEDAIKGLLAILSTADSKRPSIAIADAYHPLDALRYHLDEIVRELKLTPSVERSLLDPVVEALESFWAAAEGNPLLFAPFAIPIPTAPNQIVIQNWTFVTLGFGRRVGALARLESAIDHASNNPLLTKPIALAKAIRLTAGDPVMLDFEAIRQESREPFYAALGERIAYLASMPENDDLAQALSVFVERCLVLGPNGLDAGVFSMALRTERLLLPAETVIRGYRNRLNRDRSLVRGLYPLIRTLMRIVDPAQ